MPSLAKKNREINPQILLDARSEDGANRVMAEISTEVYDIRRYDEPEYLQNVIDNILGLAALWPRGLGDFVTRAREEIETWERYSRFYHPGLHSFELAVMSLELRQEEINHSRMFSLTDT